MPALIHCAAGKDRTGIAIALLLAAVGVEASTIAAHYALTNACLGREYLAESRHLVEARGQSWDVWATAFYSPPERMLSTLTYLESRYGGADAYLRIDGLAPCALATLRERLTEPV
ncbi:MAG: tyrosine-protein phosphatase [Chloroflexi bacterium]|nr:tyrosine-protein phosphatase [Chloroflexota bacterium]